MIFNVPQFIDVEDKIVGPLTWKQLLWMIAMGSILLILFNTVSRSVFFVVAVPIVLLFSALAFYRPYNQPLIVYVGYSIVYLFRPKIAIWQRPLHQLKERKELEKKKEIERPKEKRLTAEEIRNLARLVDTKGRA